MNVTARDIEAAMLDRCKAVAQGIATEAQDRREANTFRVAATVVYSRFPSEYEKLISASDKYFSIHPDERVPTEDVVRNGWADPPRLRDMLIRRLQGERDVK